jgi:general secretion pathway protein D
MKTNKFVPLTLGLLLGFVAAPAVRAQDQSSSPPPAAQADAPAEKAEAAPAEKPATDAATAVTADQPLRLNFRNAPLEMVLNYLSEAAGFIIVPETEVRGKIDVWSNQPVTKEEALSILDSALSKNGLTALRNGRTLTIVSKDSAKRRDIPVKSGNDPDEIPKNEELVTQIIPIHFISASQLVQNLQPLLPTGSEMTANEAGNALVLTDTQASIKRMTEIIRALDTSMAGATTIKVFALRYADAKELATLVKELFPAQTGTGGNNRGGGGGGLPAFFGGGGGGNPFGGGGGGRGGGGGNNAGGGNRAAASRVTATADEHSNSLVVNAPEDVLPAIEELVRSVDKNVEDITEVRAFRLKYADPVEMAELLTSLFPDETQTTSGGGNQVRFGGGPFGGGFGGRGGGNNNAGGGDSDLARKKGKVLAVPDQRTGSVIVKAARDLMGQIAQMVQQLDSDPAKKQKVYVYDLDNADPTEVETVLRSLFESQNTQNRNTTRNNQNQGSALTTRQNQNQNQRNNTGGFGQGAGGGGGGLGQGGGR